MKKEKESFWGEVGSGIGCFFALLGLAIFFSFPEILQLIGKLIK